MSDQNIPAFPEERIPRNGIVIEFPEDSPRLASSLAQDLRDAIKDKAVDEDAELASSIEKVNETAQDLGTVISIILGANATVAIAAGIAAWMKRSNQGVIRIRRPDGTSIDIRNADSKDMASIASAIES